ncbi:hypothetical protein J6590_057559 [Homalodisca vitripennis]|nr:hypothetical protein J6590_057559 [Homalodisca vitripennis]
MYGTEAFCRRSAYYCKHYRIFEIMLEIVAFCRRTAYYCTIEYARSMYGTEAFCRRTTYFCRHYRIFDIYVRERSVLPKKYLSANSRWDPRIMHTHDPASLLRNRNYELRHPPRRWDRGLHEDAAVVAVLAPPTFRQGKYLLFTPHYMPHKAIVFKFISKNSNNVIQVQAFPMFYLSSTDVLKGLENVLIAEHGSS